MHQYSLVDKKNGRQICIVCSNTRIDSAAYPQIIKDAAMAIEYLRVVDREIAEKYELRYIDDIEERKSGWG